MKKLLIAYDGSEASTKAIDVALKCSSKDDEIILFTVIPAELTESSFTNMLLPTIDLKSVVKSGSFKEKTMKKMSEITKQMEGKISKVETVVETGDAADEILLAAKNMRLT